MASGDTTKQLTTIVRTHLDESSAGFWKDSEIYQALANAQREIVSFSLTNYKAKAQLNQDEKLPEVLRACYAGFTNTGTVNLPAGFLYPLNLYTAAGVPILIRPHGGSRPTKKANTFLASSASQPYAVFTSSQIVLEVAGLTFSMEYIGLPADCSDSVDPVLPSFAYNAMIEYAIYAMMDKDKDPLAGSHLQYFLNEIQNIIY